MSNVTSPLLRVIQENQLLEQQQIQELTQTAEGSQSDPMPLAKLIESRGWLTRFQINQILSGRSQTLTLGVFKLLNPGEETWTGRLFEASLDGVPTRLKILDSDLVEKLTTSEALKQLESLRQLSEPRLHPLGEAHHSEGKVVLQVTRANGDPLPTGDEDRKLLKDLVRLYDGLHKAKFPLCIAHPDDFRWNEGRIVFVHAESLCFSEQAREHLTRLGELERLAFFPPEDRFVESSMIYNLAAIYYFILNGAAPFEASSPLMLLEKQKQSIKATDVVGEALAKALSFDPTQRFQTLQAFLTAIEGNPSNADLYIPPTKSEFEEEPIVLEPAEPFVAELVEESPGAEPRPTRTAPVEVEPQERPRRKPKEKKSSTPVLLASIVGLIVAGALIALISSGNKTRRSRNRFKDMDFGRDADGVVRDGRDFARDKRDFGRDKVKVPPRIPAHRATPFPGVVRIRPTPTPAAPADRAVVSWTQNKPWAIPRLTRTNITALAFTPQKDRLIAGDSWGRVTTYNLKTRKTEGSFFFNANRSLQSMQTTAKDVIMTCRGGSIAKWRGAFQFEKMAFQNRLTSDIIVSPKGDRVVTKQGNEVEIVDLATEEILCSVEVNGRALTQANFSYDGSKVCLLIDKSRILIVDINDRVILRDLNSANRYVAARISPDGTTLAFSDSFTRALRLFDIQRRSYRSLFGHNQRVNAIEFSPDGQYLLSAGRDRQIRLWDVSQRRSVNIYQTPNWSTITSIGFSSDGRVAVVGDSSGQAILFSLTRESVDPDKTIPAYPTQIGRGAVTLVIKPPTPVDTVIPLADNLRALVVDQSGVVTLWNLRTGQREKAFNSGSRLRDVAVGARGRYLYANGSRGRGIYRWSLSATPKRSSFLRDLKSGRNLILPSPDRLHLLVEADPIRNMSLLEVRTTSGFSRKVLMGHRGSILGGAFDSSGKRAVTWGTDAVRVWNLVTGRQVCETKIEKQCRQACLSPDGRKMLVLDGDSVVHLYDAELGQKLKQYQIGTGIQRIRWLSKGNRFISARFEEVPGAIGRTLTERSVSRFQLWDVDTGKALNNWQSKGCLVTKVAITPDGRYALTANDDRSLSMWNLSP